MANWVEFFVNVEQWLLVLLRIENNRPVACRNKFLLFFYSAYKRVYRSLETIGQHILLHFKLSLRALLFLYYQSSQEPFPCVKVFFRCLFFLVDETRFTFEVLFGCPFLFLFFNQKFFLVIKQLLLVNPNQFNWVSAEQWVWVDLAWNKRWEILRIIDVNQRVVLFDLSVLFERAELKLTKWLIRVVFVIVLKDEVLCFRWIWYSWLTKCLVKTAFVDLKAISHFKTHSLGYLINVLIWGVCVDVIDALQT